MDYASIKAECLQEGKLFEDEQFPAVNGSIYYSKTDDRIEWKRPGELVSEPHFMVDGATRHDLDQGRLGNCWFLAAAATLTTQPALLDNVVPPGQSFQQEYSGIFVFRFWRFGRWVEVFVDDRLPSVNGRLIFCKNREAPDEFWSALLEKAYAKVHGSYEALETGYSHDALVDFTGGLGELVDLKKDVDDPDRLYRQVSRLLRRQSLLCCAIEGSGESTLENGLVAGHAYSLSRVLDVPAAPEADGGGEVRRLVCLLNPWGRREWTGPWSDESPEWQQLSEEQREQVGLTVADDGEFWMPFEAWLENFDTLQICHLTPDSVKGGGGKKEWCVQTFHGEWVAGVTAGGCGAPPNEASYWLNPQYFLRLKAASSPGEEEGEEAATLVVSLIQKFSRRRRTQEKTEETDVPIGFDVYRYRGSAPEELDGLTAGQAALRVHHKMFNYEFQRERAARFSLDPGVYCVVPATYDPDQEAPFLLRLATEVPADAGEVGATTVTPSSEGGSASGGGRRFRELFQKHAGDDDVIDARELRRLLNDGRAAGDGDDDSSFSKETARALIRAITGERRGVLDEADCRQAWRTVRQYQATFEEFDADKSGKLDIRELRKAFKSLGFRMSKKALVSVVDKYCGKDNFLTLDDFVLAATKVATSNDSFEKVSKKRGTKNEEGKVELTYEEYMQLAM